MRGFRQVQLMCLLSLLFPPIFVGVLHAGNDVWVKFNSWAPPK